MNNNIVAVVILTLVLMGIGTQNAYASNVKPSFVQSVLDRLNFNNKHAKSLSGSEMLDRHQKNRDKFEELLNTLVDQGRITNDQKEEILNLKVMHYNEIKDLPFEERREVRMRHRDEMKLFFEKTGIDENLFQHKKHKNKDNLLKEYERRDKMDRNKAGS